jgi:hypothetical protein
MCLLSLLIYPNASLVLACSTFEICSVWQRELPPLRFFFLLNRVSGLASFDSTFNGLQNYFLEMSFIQLKSISWIPVDIAFSMLPILILRCSYNVTATIMFILKSFVDFFIDFFLNKMKCAKH